MDLLSTITAATGLRGGISGRLIAQAPWGLRFDAATAASFHIAVRGGYWLRLDDGSDPILVEEGDVVLLAHCDRYTAGDQLDALPEPFPSAPVMDSAATTFRVGGSGAESVVVCGVYEFSAGLSHPLLQALPPLVHLRAGQVPRGSALDSAVQLLIAELDSERQGTQDVISRLVDVLLIYLLRSWQELNGTTKAGWYGALHDPQISRALALMHQEPDRRWTVRRLADDVGLSRAAFARRFTGMVGQPPLGYLTDWRMTTAAVMLRDGIEPIAVIADQVGYDSEFAFARTFRRFHGQSPGRFRKHARLQLER